MSLARNFATVGGSTLTSRLFGFVRDMVMAAALGTGPVADAFLVAFRLPNLFRRLFAEGAFASAFIPVYIRQSEERGEAEAEKFAGEVLSILVLVLLVVVAAAEIAAAPLISLLAPGFAAEPDKFALTVLLTRITLPYLAFLALIALYGGLLNARGRFLAAAMAPTLLNLVLIVALAYVLLSDRQQTEEAGLWLTAATLVGGGLQLALVVAATRRAGLSIRLRRPRLTPAVRRLLTLVVPGFVAGGVTQINIVVGTMIASFAPGAIAVLGYADRLYQLPFGIVGATVGVVVLPSLAQHLRAGELDAAAALQNRSIEFAMGLTLPAAVGLITLAEPIVRVIFERGAFDAADTLATSRAVVGFAAGLPAFVLIKVFSPAFFAREDTATPMGFAGLAVIVNTAGSLLLFPRFGPLGIALATSVSAWIHAAALGWVLARRGHLSPDARLTRSLPLLVVAALVMGAAVWLGAHAFGATLSGRGPAAALVVGLLSLGGAALFAALCHLLRIADLVEAFRSLRSPRR